MPAEQKRPGLVSRVYHTVMRDGSVAAVGRDALKSVNATLMQTFFGQGQHGGGEPGSPLNPLFYDIDRARQEHTSALYGVSPEASNDPAAPTPSQIVDNPGPHLAPPEPAQGHTNEQERDKGTVHGNGAPPTPSQIVDNPKPHLPEPPSGQEQQQQQHQQGREM